MLVSKVMPNVSLSAEGRLLTGLICGIKRLDIH